MGGPKNPKQPILSLIWDQMHSVPLGREMRLQLQLRLSPRTGSFSCRVLFNQRQCVCARAVSFI